MSLILLSIRQLHPVPVKVISNSQVGGRLFLHLVYFGPCVLWFKEQLSANASRFVARKRTMTGAAILKETQKCFSVELFKTNGRDIWIKTLQSRCTAMLIMLLWYDSFISKAHRLDNGETKATWLNVSMHSSCNMLMLAFMLVITAGACIAPDLVSSTTGLYFWAGRLKLRRVTQNMPF